MISIQTVNPTQVHQIWDIVGPFIKSAVDVAVGNADCTISQLKLQLVSGAQTLLVAIENDKIIGAASIQVSTLPNHRVATLTATGGRGVTNPEVMEQVVAWAKAQGATKIRAFASGARIRLYRQQLGLNATETVVEKLI
jgi:hypothetical protein